LVAASHTRGAAITVWGTPGDPAVQYKVIPYVVSVLRRLGYRAKAHIVSGTYLPTAPKSVFDTIQMTPPGWYDSTPYGFFASWFDCKSPLNHGWFCSEALERGIVEARALEASDPRAAAVKWAALDRLVTDQAAWVPLVNPRGVLFLSARVGNFQNHPVLGLIADQLTVN
jgi:peptide/nickel transport system substrate-binding protein